MLTMGGGKKKRKSLMDYIKVANFQKAKSTLYLRLYPNPIGEIRSCMFILLFPIVVLKKN